MGVDILQLPGDQTLRLFYSMMVDDVVCAELPRVRAREVIDDFIEQQMGSILLQRAVMDQQERVEWARGQQARAAHAAAMNMFGHAPPPPPPAVEGGDDG